MVAFLLILALAVRRHGVGFIPDFDLLGFHPARFFDILPATDIELRVHWIHIRLSGIGPALAVGANGATGEQEREESTGHKQ